MARALLRYKLRWALYLSLIALRFLGAIKTLPGYIHPDEFFQGGQELFFGQQLDGSAALRHEYAVRIVPWEFEPMNAVRSIVPPAFMTLLPLQIYASVKSMVAPSFRESQAIQTSTQFPRADAMNQLSGREILIVPRIFMTLLSLLLLDGSLVLLTFLKQRPKESARLSDVLYYIYQHGPPTEVIIIASSWPCLVFGIRPFTNTLEAMCLSTLLVLVNLDLSSAKERMQLPRTICIGVVFSIGIFVRFTFAFFAVPVVLIWLWHGSKISYKMLHFVHNLIWLAVAFLTTSATFIVVDTKYYSTQANGREVEEDSSSILRYIAPLNAFLYNSKSKNLAKHGLHPRITHAAVNMPMLFGPLALLWYKSVAQHFFGATHNKIQNESFENMSCKWSIISGLFVLSCAPHQEPRFLLPCLIPLVLLCGRESVGIEADMTNQRKRTGYPIILKVFWVIFNLILYIFFGCIHQGGLVDTLLNTQHIANTITTSPSIHIYYKTYMPPSFLARGDMFIQSEDTMQDQCTKSDNLDHSKSHTCYNELQTSPKKSRPNTIVLDLQGNQPSVLLNALQSYQLCSEEGSSIIMRLTTPMPVAATLAHKRINDEFTWQGYSFHQVYVSPLVHVSTEDWPEWNGSVVEFVSRLRLVTYDVTCNR